MCKYKNTGVKPDEMACPRWMEAGEFPKFTAKLAWPHWGSWEWETRAYNTAREAWRVANRHAAHTGFPSDVGIVGIPCVAMNRESGQEGVCALFEDTMCPCTEYEPSLFCNEAGS